jgi:RimJ/RimL family protein N-acetyltransferase
VEILQGVAGRTVLASNADIALAQFFEGERECIEAEGDHTFDLDPDDRPVPFQFNSFRAAIVDAKTGELLGRMSWRPVPLGPTLSSTAWNLGIQLLPSAYRRGLGAQAGLLLARYLFDTTEVDRVQALSEVDNVPGVRGLERAGFHREGILRGCTMRDGKRRDTVLFSLLRSDLER